MGDTKLQQEWACTGRLPAVLRFSSSMRRWTNTACGSRIDLTCVAVRCASRRKARPKEDVEQFRAELRAAATPEKREKKPPKPASLHEEVFARRAGRTYGEDGDADLENEVRLDDGDTSLGDADLPNESEEYRRRRHDIQRIQRIVDILSEAPGRKGEIKRYRDEHRKLSRPCADRELKDQTIVANRLLAVQRRRRQELPKLAHRVKSLLADSWATWTPHRQTWIC